MAGYDQTIKVQSKHRAAAKAFFAFLQAVGKKYSRPTKINYRYLGRGRFYVTVDGNPGGIDALLQELILNKGLYYYVCSIRSSNKREIVRHAVVPIFQDLIESRFENPYSRFLRRHLSGVAIDEKYIPGDFIGAFAHQYEVLVRKWDIGSIDDWNFIKDVDALLTQFMLDKTEHVPGQKSPPFSYLVDRAYRKGLGMMKEIKALFNQLHDARTNGLHRRKLSLTHEQISDVAIGLFQYFQYLDDFEQSQTVKIASLRGKRYRRIKYGDEKWSELESDDGAIWKPDPEAHCHDCAAIRGQYHCEGCDWERCPRCGGQFLGCDCTVSKRKAAQFERERKLNQKKARESYGVN